MWYCGERMFWFYCLCVLVWIYSYMAEKYLMYFNFYFPHCTTNVGWKSFHTNFSHFCFLLCEWLYGHILWLFLYFAIFPFLLTWALFIYDASLLNSFLIVFIGCLGYSRLYPQQIILVLLLLVQYFSSRTFPLRVL